MKEYVIVVTDDTEVIKVVSKVLTKKNYCLFITSSKIHSIFNILDDEIAFFIFDYDLSSNSNTQLISIIKRIRPKLPIIVILADNSINKINLFAESGVFYRAIKPLDENEMEQVVDAVHHYLIKRRHVNEAVEKMRDN